MELNLRLVPNHKRYGKTVWSRLVCIAAAALLSGCRPAPALKLHYLSDFVPGSRSAFQKARIEIARPTGLTQSDRLLAGAVFDPDGNLKEQLYTVAARDIVQQAIVRSFSDAGMEAVALSSPPRDHQPGKGSAFLLTSKVNELRVEKTFGPQQTVHGQYFTMHSRVRIAVEIFDRTGHLVFSGEFAGSEDEPPAPVGGEVFFPLETDPGESLSVAMSRAVGSILVDTRVRHVLPSNQ